MTAREDPAAEATEFLLPPLVNRIPESTAGLRVRIRGRSVLLRRLRRPPTGIMRWVAAFGPGLITGAAANDAGGIATFSQLGAKFGYELLWVLVLSTISLAIVQEMCARLGAATGRGLLDLIRERFGLGWAIFIIGVVLLANGSLVVTEFAGVSAGAELLGVSRFAAVPVAAALIWYLVVAGTYGWVERVFLAMTLVFLAYPAAALLAKPNWGAVAHGALVPTLSRDSEFLIMLVALLGATITPYQQLFQQSLVVEKGVARQHYGPERLETYQGMALSNVVSAFVVIATGATLHASGVTNITTAAEAAEALRPVAGEAARALFAVGLIGASLLAGAVLPLATAYSVSEAFGFRKGVNLDFRRGRTFLGLFTAIVVTGAAVALVPGVPLIQLLVGVQVLNGILLPLVLVFILLLINDRRLAGSLANTRIYNVLGWGTFGVVTVCVVVLLGQQLLGALGVLG